MILALLAGACPAFAQVLERQVIGSLGSYNAAGSLQVSSTVGEAVTPTYTQATLVVTQGFQQPVSTKTDIDSFSVTGVPGIMPDGDVITAYPNPAMDQVVLDIRLNGKQDLGITVYNALGQQMADGLQLQVSGPALQALHFHAYAAGTYFIVIRSTDGKLNHSIKVQKYN